MTAEQADTCHAGGWSDSEIAAYLARRDRLLRWRWPVAQAEALAERLTLRDREAEDRHLCIECQHCRPGLICAAHRAAGVGRELGRALASLLQRCPAFILIGGNDARHQSDQ
jgi:hypothetical protein